MRAKTADILCAFCVSCGGLSLALLYRVDALTMLFILTLSVAFSLFCCAIADRHTHRGWVKKIFALGMLASAAVSIYSGTRLVCDFSLDNSFIPICLFLGCITSLCISLSSLRACKSVAAISGFFCIILLLAILILGVIKSDFSKAVSITCDKRLIFPLAVSSSLQETS